MSQKIASLYAEIGADTSKLKTGLNEAQSGLAGMGKKLAVSALQWVSFGAAANAAIDFVMDSVNAYAASETVLTQLNATLKSTGREMEVTSERIGDMADELSKLTAFDDEDITAGFNALMKFDSIPTDKMQSLVEISLDMAAAMGGDVASNADQLGRILETGLIPRTWGFSEALKDNIQKQIKAGDTAGALNSVIAELNKRFGGQAVAQLNTYAGQTKKLQNAWENYMEAIGEDPASVMGEWKAELADALETEVELLNTRREYNKETGKRPVVYYGPGGAPAMNEMKEAIQLHKDIEKEYQRQSQLELYMERIREAMAETSAAAWDYGQEMRDAIAASGGAEFKLDYVLQYGQMYDETTAKIKENEIEIARLRKAGYSDAYGPLAGLLAENEKLGAEMDKWSKQMLFNFAQAALLADGLQPGEIDKILGFAVELGIMSETAADAAKTAWNTFISDATVLMDTAAADTTTAWKGATDDIKAMMEEIPNIVTVTVQKQGEGGNSSQTHSSGGGSEGSSDNANMDDKTNRAMGGQLRPGRWSVVGERGWELISPTGYVYSHEKSKQMTHNARPFAEGGQLGDMDLSAAFDRLATRIIYGVRDAVQQVV